jgi:hypothetical protein
MPWGKNMNNLSPVFPFGTSVLFVFFVLYAIWLIFKRPKSAYGAAWKLASAAFLAGVFLAMLVGTWVEVEGMLIGLSIILSLWTVGNLWMAERLMLDRIELIKRESHGTDPRLPSDYRLHNTTDAELIDLIGRTYSVLHERDVQYDVPPATNGSCGTTQRLTTPGK